MNKTRLKELALEVRMDDLKIGVHDVFDPYKLADIYGVDIYPLSRLEVECPDALAHFTSSRPHVFSGALIPLEPGHSIIIENDSHLIERRRSTTSHEMAHVLLEHSFSTELVNENGCRMDDPDQEAEAIELSGELLLPFEAAKRLAFRDATDEEAARLFQVSIQLAAWRLNGTGARKIARRARNRRHRPRSLCNSASLYFEEVGS